MVNMISGGLHAGGNLDFQDFLIIPVGAASYSQALEMTVAIYRAVGARPARERGSSRPWSATRGDTAPGSATNEQAVEIVLEADARLRLRARAATWRSRSTSPSSHFFDPATRHLPASTATATRRSTPAA